MYFTLNDTKKRFVFKYKNKLLLGKYLSILKTML